MTENKTKSYFRVGGTLHLNTPSYVKRPADDDLFEQVLAGKFCYVLTSRQMGKSSLMLRTAQRLKDQNIQSVIEIGEFAPNKGGEREQHCESDKNELSQDRINRNEATPKNESEFE